MPGPTGYAFNRTRGAYLATRLSFANTYWTRLRGLMGDSSLPNGHGLWIVPSHGVHTFAMRFHIDVAYLNRNKAVVHMAHCLKPWRMAKIVMNANSVIELPANTLKSTGSSIGDEIEIELGIPPERVENA